MASIFDGATPRGFMSETDEEESLVEAQEEAAEEEELPLGWVDIDKMFAETFGDAPKDDDFFKPSQTTDEAAENALWKKQKEEGAEEPFDYASQLEAGWESGKSSWLQLSNLVKAGWNWATGDDEEMQEALKALSDQSVLDVPASHVP